MVKCESCSRGDCERKYENRGKCKDPENCSCTCQEEPETTFWKGFGSIALGTAAFAGGVVLTVSTGGLGAVGIAAAIGGGALTGAGATAAIHPVAKKLNGERITGSEYVKDVAIGGVAGAVTGPIGLGGATATTTIASKVGTEGVKQGAVKLGCRAAVGATSGAAAAIVQETVQAATDEEQQFSVTNVLKSAAVGAVTGGAGHVTSNVTRNINPGVVCSATKVVVDTASSVVIDAGTQLITEGEIDGKRLALNAGARAATSAGYEAVASATYKAHGGKEALKDKLADEETLKKVDPADREEILRAKENLEKMHPDKVASELNKAIEATNVKKEINRISDEKRIVEAQRNEVNDKLLSLKNDAPTVDKNEMKTLQTEKEALQKTWKKQSNAMNKLEKNMPKPEMMGERNLHALRDDHLLQFAADLSDPNNNLNTRGERRVLFDVKSDNRGNVRANIAGIVEEHKYDNAPGYKQRSVPQLKVVEPFVIPKEYGAEDEDEDLKNV